MAEQKITQHLLANLLQGKREKDARMEALLEAIKIPSNINKLLKINSNKPFKVTHDIRKIFDEESINLKAVVEQI